MAAGGGHDDSVRLLLARSDNVNDRDVKVHKSIVQHFRYIHTYIHTVHTYIHISYTYFHTYI